MTIKITGAKENNLRNVDVEIKEGLTVVTGISGSGKSSLVYDTLYHEARRRYIDTFTPRSFGRLPKANVESIANLNPAIAVDQNVLNRNPLSTLATASGLHPFIRILYSTHGVRFCPQCQEDLVVFSEDAIIDIIKNRLKASDVEIYAPVAKQSIGSHETLLNLLTERFASKDIIVDGNVWQGGQLKPEEKHSIEIMVGELTKNEKTQQIREVVQSVFDLGGNLVIIKYKEEKELLTTRSICRKCDYWFEELESKYFHMKCDHCKGEGCNECNNTGLYPEASTVKWEGLILPELLDLSVDDAYTKINQAFFPNTAKRLKEEIKKRLLALKKVGLGYLQLNRISPSLSRGESQRVRLAIILTSKLEGMLHILDEPTIGQHPNDVIKFLPAFRELAGPVVFVEHDRVAASVADNAIDIGPGAGREGGEIIFNGLTSELWKEESATGRYFSFRELVLIPDLREKPEGFFNIRGAHLHNLKNIDVKIPLERISVISGVSGSGKSTLVKHILYESLNKGDTVGCKEIDELRIKPVLVDQSPIGRNPRSNPATYTKLSDIIRDLFAEASNLSISHFSFNRPEGRCEKCEGIGAEKVKLPYISPIWLPCDQCSGKRFKDEVLEVIVDLNGRKLSVGDLYGLSIEEAAPLIIENKYLSENNRKKAKTILHALIDIGLGYLHLGQASPTLSGGEAQRVKLAKYLGRKDLSKNLIILDEPSTGLHPNDISGLLVVLDRLARAGATIIIVEHNTDIIRAADWVIDLGPGAGPKGGELIFSGPVEDLLRSKKSLTAEALREEQVMIPERTTLPKKLYKSGTISIKGARANNLKNINLDIPKGQLIVVTGLSGSGKSSLVTDVLEREARRRFLESLSIYERQSTKEGPEADVDSVTGLGVTANTRVGGTYYSWRIDPRYNVGNASGIMEYLLNLVAYLGEKQCKKCSKQMEREDSRLFCKKCNEEIIIIPNHLSPLNLQSHCTKCKGIGNYGLPNIDKLIIHPDKPICGGAMYSPGFWPFGYYCKQYNHPYYTLRAMAEKYGYDPENTPWNKMSKEAQNAFLFGTEEVFEFEYETRTVSKATRKSRWWGPFNEWGSSYFQFGDLYETYTDRHVCDQCNGQKLREEYLTIKVNGKNIHELKQLTFKELLSVLEELSEDDFEDQFHLLQYWERIKLRLKYLNKVGLGYLNADRLTHTLSAGESERLRLVTALGSGLTALTVLLDEPSRGLHPSEIKEMIEVLQEIRNNGNTVIVVEHDPEIIQSADHIIDMGPGPGVKGGKVVVQGKMKEILQSNTLTAKWLKGERKTNPIYEREGQRKLFLGRRKPKDWLEIKQASENNLKGEDFKIPLGVLTGICGVSGSGKSSLVFDTLGIAITPENHTTSLGSRRRSPGKHKSIENAPKQALLIDQSRRKIHSPLRFFNLIKPLTRLYAGSEKAEALEMKTDDFKKGCSECQGMGAIKIEMGFLPSVISSCDICKGTGYAPEIWEVKLHGYSLPELSSLTIEEVYELFKYDGTISRYLKAAIDVGLGYLCLNQPRFTMSGGEAQRLKIAKELCKKTKQGSLYILDEPTVGLHLEDVEILIKVLQRLVDTGNSVLVVEHHPHVLAACDYLVELGPVGGPDGGYLVGEGTPEEISEKNTPSSQFIKKTLEGKL
ncbi:MAG: ATP-binding cassette domain-containing protein [Candidatus Heimdallarchaeaceae archaeon]